MDLNALDEPMEIVLPHEFETEVQLLVTENHQLTIGAIEVAEDEYLKATREDMAGEDHETIRAVLSQGEYFYDGLRRAAHHTALVSLVTRLDHWIRKFMRRLGLVLTGNKSQAYIARAMEALNGRLGTGPVPIEFFEKLVTARDSVIHADSQAEWQYQGATRHIAKEYENPYGELDFSADHLREAVKNVTTQIEWYDERVTRALAGKP